MIIHSVAPAEYLLPKAELPDSQYKPFEGGLLEGKMTAEGFSISRVISTNPAAYLNPLYTPGSLYSDSTPKQG